MKKLLIAFAIVLFTVSAGAQETKPAATKTESCCKAHKKMTPEEKEKCEAKCKAEGKTCTDKDKKKCKKEEKSCCAAKKQ